MRNVWRLDCSSLVSSPPVSMFLEVRDGEEMGKQSMICYTVMVLLFCTPHSSSLFLIPLLFFSAYIQRHTWAVRGVATGGDQKKIKGEKDNERQKKKKIEGRNKPPTNPRSFPLLHTSSSIIVVVVTGLVASRVPGKIFVAGLSSALGKD